MGLLGFPVAVARSWLMILAGAGIVQHVCPLFEPFGLICIPGCAAAHYIVCILVFYASTETYSPCTPGFAVNSYA